MRRRAVLRKVVKKRYELHGGPYNGKTARLEEGSRCTLPLSIGSQWRGQYVRTLGEDVFHWVPSGALQPETRLF